MSEIETIANSIYTDYSCGGRLCGDQYEYIGEGYSRVVYRQGDFVFKFEFEDASEDDCNFVEFDSYMALLERDLPAGYAIPATDYFILDDGNSCIVMEYIEGEALPFTTDGGLSEVIFDSYSYNLVQGNDGIVYQIDLGAGLQD